jgi:hypothetical protein
MTEKVTESTDGLILVDREFWQRAFLAVLPTAMTVQGWTLGQKKISTGEDRMRLAAAWADTAAHEERIRFGPPEPESEIEIEQEEQK